MNSQIGEPTQDTTSNSTLETPKVDYSKNKQLVEVIEIKDQPFKILKWEEKYYLTLGKYRLTEALDSKEEAEAEVTNVSWHRILQVMHIVVAEEIKADKSGKGLSAVINNQ